MFVFTTEISKLYTEAQTNTTVVRECNAAHDREALHFGIFSSQLGIFSSQLGTTDNSNSFPFFQGFWKNNGSVSSMPGSQRWGQLAVQVNLKVNFENNPLHATEFKFSFIRIEKERWEITTIKLELGMHSDTEELWKATKLSAQYTS